MDANAEVLKVGLIGFGAVGRGLAEVIARGAVGPVEVVGVLVTDTKRHVRDMSDTGWDFVDDLDRLLARGPQVIAEAGGHDAVRQHVERCLLAGIDVAITGVGALEDGDLVRRLEAASRSGAARLRVCSGAIAGLDGLAAASILGTESVTHVVRKPPEALVGRVADDHVMAVGAATELYAGPARMAVRLYPQNVNVVAAVALAGIGFDRTMVRIIADPSVDRNIHEVTARGPFGELRITMVNVPTVDNPRTGRIVAGALAHAIRSFRSPIVIG